jgi:hypothetical protein
MWTPDPQIEQHLARIITRAFEDARLNEQREEKAADAALATRGVYHSGINLMGRRERAAATFKVAGERSITETVEALTEILRPLPPEAISWLRSNLKTRFESYAHARAQSLASDRLRQQMKIPDRGDLARAMNEVRSSLDRDLEIALVPLELKARLGAIAGGALPSEAPGPRSIDAFVSHAGEDKAAVAKPIADKLIALGFTVWLDQYELKIGDSVYEKIDDGLRRCRFGVVILSPHFFAKNWPRRELTALAALGDVEGRNKILPVWHTVSQADVARISPLLADVYAADTQGGLDVVVQHIAQTLGTPQPGSGDRV